MVVAAGSATLKKPRELSAGVPASSISASSKRWTPERHGGARKLTERPGW